MYVIKNGTLYTMDYSKENPSGILKADLLLKNGKIAEIGEDLQKKYPGAEVIDAEGKCVTPGFVDAHSHVGGFPASGDQDLNEMTNPVTAELDAYYGINPADTSFKDVLRQGITTSCLVPGSANVVCGWGVIMKSAGEDRIVQRGAVLKAAMGINPKGCYSGKGMTPMTRMAIANTLKTYLRSVKEYMKKQEEAKDDASKMPAYDLAMEHGIPVIEKKIPLKVHSYMQDMMQLLEIAKEEDIMITLDHALGAGDFVEELTDPHVQGVIYGPTSEPLFGGEGGKLDYDCCRKLDDAGVDVCVMTDGPVSPVNMLIYEAGEAVRRGMDPVKALGLLTVNPAKILNQADRIGSLKEGLDADVLIWNGMPTDDADAVLETVLIDGKIVWKSAS